MRADFKSSFFIRQESWIMQDFPKVTVGILEITVRPHKLNEKTRMTTSSWTSISRSVACGC